MIARTTFCRRLRFVPDMIPVHSPICAGAAPVRAWKIWTAQFFYASFASGTAANSPTVTNTYLTLEIEPVTFPRLLERCRSRRSPLAPVRKVLTNVIHTERPRRGGFQPVAGGHAFHAQPVLNCSVPRMRTSRTGSSSIGLKAISHVETIRKCSMSHSRIRPGRNERRKAADIDEVTTESYWFCAHFPGHSSQSSDDGAGPWPPRTFLTDLF